MTDEGPLERVARIQALKRIELEEKGYGADLAKAAVDRAWNRAIALGKPLPKDMQERALVAFFDEELKYVERYMDGMRASFMPATAEGAAENISGDDV